MAVKRGWKFIEDGDGEFPKAEKKKRGTKQVNGASEMRTREVQEKAAPA